MNSNKNTNYSVTFNRFGLVGRIDTSVSQRTNTSIRIGPSAFLQQDGVPCHHMIAMVKSLRIEGLNPNNAMPFWWTTECWSWRRQYPADTNVTCNFDMNALKTTLEDGAMK